MIFPAVQQRLPPLAAAGAMALSSVSVVVSSLLLNRFVPTSKQAPREQDTGVSSGQIAATLLQNNEKMMHPGERAKSRAQEVELGAMMSTGQKMDVRV